MKKSAFILIFGIALTLVCAIAAGFAVHNSAVELSIAEYTVYGDVNLAAGLKVNVSATYEDKLFWHSDFTPSEDVSLNTEHHIYLSKQSYDYDARSEGIILYLPSSTFTSGHITEDFPHLLEAAFLDHAENVSAHESYSADIYLKDYIDYYIPIIETYSDFSFHMYNSFDLLAQDFKIPVLDDEQVTIEIEKDGEGNIVGAGYSSISEGYMGNMYAYSKANDEAVFFTFNLRNSEDEIMDSSELTYGYGIYKLPYTPSTSDYSLNRMYHYNTSLLCELPTEIRISDLLISDDDSKILLLSSLDEIFTLKVIDTQNGEFLQEIILPTGFEDESYHLVGYKEDMLLLASNSKLALITLNDEGTYSLTFTSDLHSSRESLPMHNLDFAYDAKSDRIAIAGTAEVSAVDNNYYIYTPNIELQIYTAVGLAYHGVFENSINPTALYSDYNYNVRDAGPRPININWT